jgi:hypothetical protein
VVAWRLLWLTYQARQSSEVSCEIALEQGEWHALYAQRFSTTTMPSVPPTLHEAVRWIAQLGGFLARTRDGEPGVQTIWQGLRRLTDLTQIWKLHHPETPHSLPTCG